MTPPHGPAAGRPPDAGVPGPRCPAVRLIAAACAPMLAGAVTLVLEHEAGLMFLALFTASTSVMVLLMAGTGHGTPRARRAAPRAAGHGRPLAGSVK